MKTFFKKLFLILGIVIFLFGVCRLLEGCAIQLKHPLPPEGSFRDPSPKTLEEHGKGWKKTMKGIGLIIFGGFIVMVTKDN